MSAIDPAATLRAVRRGEAALRALWDEILDVRAAPARLRARRRLIEVSAELQLIAAYAEAAAQIDLPIGESTGARRTGGL